MKNASISSYLTLFATSDLHTRSPSCDDPLLCKITDSISNLKLVRTVWWTSNWPLKAEPVLGPPGGAEIPTKSVLTHSPVNTLLVGILAPRGGTQTGPSLSDHLWAPKRDPKRPPPWSSPATRLLPAPLVPRFPLPPAPRTTPRL